MRQSRQREFAKYTVTLTKPQIEEKVVAMPTSIVREEVERLIREEAAHLIEVLPIQEFQDEHIKGATNIPLKRLNRETTSHLDKTRPIIVY